jgi:hypothetical protein
MIITGYILLIYFTMPAHVPDIKVQVPVATVDECVVMGSEYLQQFSNAKSVGFQVRCLPIGEKPSDNEERVD